MVSNRGLQDLVNQVLNCPNHRNNKRRLSIRDMDLDLQIQLEFKSLNTFGINLTKILVKLMSFRLCFRPVQCQDISWDNHGLITMRVDWIFAGS